MLLNKCFTTAFSTLILFGVAAVASAQQDRNDQSRERDRAQAKERPRGQQGQDQQSQQRFDQRRQDEQRRTRQGQQGAQQGRGSNSGIRLSPTGWVRIATDYDNDGRFDAVETMYIYDLQRARQASRERSQRQADEAFRGGDRAGRRNQQRSRQRQETVQGQIQELQTVQLAGMDGDFVTARIKTREGHKAKVLLGPKSQLSKLDLRQGDQVTVQGVRGHINDRTMLIARQVSSGDNQISPETPGGRHLKRVHAEILSTRTAKFRGRDERYIVAQVELRSGKRETVNLGPESKVSDLNLEKGDQIAMLVRPGRINRQPAMIAEQIRTGDQTIELPRPQNQTRFRGQQRDNARLERRYRDDARGQDQTRGREGRRDQQGRRTRDEEDRMTYDGRERAALGVMLSESSQRGVQIARILRDTPADRSELQEGDQVLSIAGQEVNSYRDMLSALQDAEPNERIEIRVRRDGETRTINVRLASRSSVFDNRNLQNRNSQYRNSQNNRNERD